MGEVFRTVRFVNIPLGLLVAVGPFFSGQAASLSVQLTSAVLGIVAVLLAWRLGPISEKYGSWDRYVK